MLENQAVEQGDYPEITMDGFKYAEKVTYATWTSQSFGSEWGFPGTSPDTSHGTLPSDSMMQMLNWSLGKEFSS